MTLLAAAAALLAIAEVAYRAILRRRDRLYLRLLRAVTTALEEGGVEYWLDWGTLLGAWREGGILRHDTDMDLAVPLEQAEAARRCLAACAALHGYEVRDEAERGLAIFPGRDPTIHSLQDAVHLGLTFLDVRRDPGTVVRRQGASFPLDEVLPLARLPVCGRMHPVPANPQAYLERMYGYTGRICLHQGKDRYAPCRTMAEYALYFWNQMVFYRVYFLWNGLPKPRRWKQAIEERVAPLYRRMLPEAKT